jgi:hypothetical protein
MTTTIALILFPIFLFLSSIHIYWGFGGQWGNGAVVPTKDDNTKVILTRTFTNFYSCIWVVGVWVPLDTLH